MLRNNSIGSSKLLRALGLQTRQTGKHKFVRSNLIPATPTLNSHLRDGARQTNVQCTLRYLQAAAARAQAQARVKLQTHLPSPTPAIWVGCADWTRAHLPMRIELLAVLTWTAVRSVMQAICKVPSRLLLASAAHATDTGHADRDTRRAVHLITDSQCACRLS